ncbi:MAG: hypothetical protein E6H08_22250 [Bacteroidetes bacterium]|nr:MAG: hypothetical protein E6H08_22250 [Bacteroidota bacterium]
MKKISTTTLLFIICFGLAAQYKKASFFGKEGRTYGIGSQLYALGDGKGSPIGFAVTFGRDREGKQFFSSWELQYLPSYKFSFETTDYNDEPITVNGAAKAHLIYAVNYGYHLLKNEEDKKIKPYVSAGFNIVMMGGIKSDNNNSYDNKKVLGSQTFSAGLKGGVGVFYNFSPKFSLKLDGGYNYQFNMDIDEGGDYTNYFLFTSHPYVSAGIRFRLTREE